MSPEPSSFERAQLLAQTLECRVGEVSLGASKARPAVFGGAGRFASTLKHHGGSWNHSRKAHVFDDWDTVAASLTQAAHRMGHDVDTGEPVPAPGLASDQRDLLMLFAKARSACEHTRSTVERSCHLRETMALARFPGSPRPERR
jgi:hypothetical protein